MHIVDTSFTSKAGKTYTQTLIRESYREDGKVKKRTIANISDCSKEEIAAIKFALKNKHDWHNFINVKKLKNQQGISFGATFAVHEIIKKIGIEKTLHSFGNQQQAKLALWQIIARVIDQGSRLSAVRMARDEVSDEIIHFEKNFNEDDLYKNLDWISKNQENIEKRLFEFRTGKNPPSLFLYDVTSSYLEGVCNELADWGYNRDKKKGKQQIVIGLLCDDKGIPVSTEVFAGNTNDTTTFASQIKKVSQKFGCKNVTFVGDKGMIKSSQIADLNEEKFHYITSITKSQIEKFIKEDIFQMGLFDENLVEIEHEGIRYIMRKNHIREKEIQKSRNEKQISIEKLVKNQNEYLENHPKASFNTAIKKIENKINHLKASQWISVSHKEDENDKKNAKDENNYIKENNQSNQNNDNQNEKNIKMRLEINIDEEKKQEAGKFDGVYCLKTDLPAEVGDTQTIHDRYKDLIWVENAFRTSKTSHLELRPLYVVTEESTRGHMLICMLAYMIEQELRKAWVNLDITPEEGLKRLRTLSTNIVLNEDGSEFHQIPEPNQQNQELLDCLNIKPPIIIPKRKIHVDTRKKIC